MRDQTTIASDHQPWPQPERPSLPTIPWRPSPAGSTSRCGGRSSTARKTMPPKWTSRSGWITSSASTPTRCASPPAAWWRSIRRRSNITAPAAGSPSVPTISGRLWRAAGSWAWPWSPEPTLTPPTRTSTATIPTGSPWMPKGRKRRHWEMPDMWVTCALGPYNFEFMTEVTKEIVSTFPEVGGIFSNRWEGSGMCYCEHCVRNFRDYCGMDLPRTNNQHDPARRNYIVWREKRLFELWRLWDGEIRKINPAARYIANSGGANGGLDMRDGRRACAHAVRRPAGPQRRDGAVGQRQERQRVPLHAGAQSRSAASSIWAWWRRTAGPIRCRTATRRASGCSTASPTDCGRGSTKSARACTTTAG